MNDRIFIFALCLALWMASGVTLADEAEETSFDVVASKILEESGVQGGLIVHLGCGDGRLTTALGADGRFVVHGLAVNATEVAEARSHVRSLGVYGKVSIDTFDGTRLPYADNMVNLLTAGTLGGVSREEVMRVLVPGGVAIIGGERIVKPWPEAIDDWTHFLHGPDGNAVSRDRLVGKPRSLRWLDDPKFARHHDEVLTTSAVVASGGRIFSIVDYAPRSTFHERIGGKYFLIARDAFNGVQLWKRPIADWGWKSWGARQNVRFSQPIQLPKRMVAHGDRLYVTLGWNAPVSVIDAASGDVIQTLEHSKYADEILFCEEKLIVSSYEQAVRPLERQSLMQTSREEVEPIKKRIRAIDPETGKLLWQTEPLAAMMGRFDAVAPQAHLELTVKAGRVFAITEHEIVCFSMTDGRLLWKRPRPEFPIHKMMLGVSMHNNCTVLADDERLYVAQPVGKLRNTFHTIPCDLYAYDAKTGQQQWCLQRKIGTFAWGIHADVFLIDGQLWSHEHHETAMRGADPVDHDSIPYALVAIDPQAGEITQRIDTRMIFNIAHHARCYRNKATERFVLAARRGTELIDIESGELDINHWVRGECRFGIMPAYGQLFMPPDPCACHARIKVDGFLSLADGAPPTADDSPRLVRGAAYDAIERTEATELDWPMFRGNARRQGYASSEVGGELQEAWTFDADEPISQAVVVGEQVFIACKESHRVKAISLATGREMWSFMAGARIDSAPTFCRGRIIFGSADGYVYCLRATDGMLAWKFRAAPARRLIMVRGQLESAWPVHGSVLTKDGTAYIAAGRSSYLDGGIHAFALDVETGQILKQRTIHSSYDNEKRSSPSQTYDADGALNHLLVSDSRTVYLQNAPLFGAEPDEVPDRSFLMATCGMLDGSMFNRTGWAMVGASRLTGSQIVHDDRTSYITKATKTFNRSNVFIAETGYDLFEALLPSLPESFAQFDTAAFASLGYRTGKATASWQRKIPIRGQAMLLTPGTLLVCGFPDVVPQDDAYAAFEGRLGGKLMMIDRKNGNTITEHGLTSPPVWNGLSMGAGRIFISLTDGKLLCLKPQ